MSGKNRTNRKNREETAVQPDQNGGPPEGAPLLGSGDIDLTGLGIATGTLEEDLEQLQERMGQVKAARGIAEERLAVLKDQELRLDGAIQVISQYVGQLQSPQNSPETDVEESKV